MKGLSSRIYSKEYYLSTCLGSFEFNKFYGKKVNEEIKDYVSKLPIKKGTRLLDIGCGRGDLAIEAARKGAIVTGIDYSKAGIYLAKQARSKQAKKLRHKLVFVQMNAKKLRFKDNSFDLITSFDVFEHLYKEELEVALSEVYRVLAPNGVLIVHTETNKLYLDLTHRLWCYPMDTLLVNINKLITHSEYPRMPQDPRSDVHKKQHVNEPTHNYLVNLFSKNKFKGKIIEIVPYKPKLSIKDVVYNVIVYLYPISNYFPLNLFFATEYICIMQKE